ncbi:MAG: PepSY domain-containing protein [Oscillospiraceae bacterium]|nr:PepSY domain-containing protein [Oscillospiraceae bacterium]
MDNMNKLSDSQLEGVAGGMITEDEAVAAALAHVKAGQDQVEFMKRVELDYEHGRKIYEIEFYMGGFEYEFDIDAETGRVIKCKKERD